MSVVSTDTLQLSHVAEVTSGVTPTSPVFDIWRTTGESLVFSPETSESQELGGGGRFAKPANVTGMTISGDINFPLAKFDALEAAIAGVFAATWGQCPLTGATGGAIDSVNRVTVGQVPQTFTIEKRFANPAYVAGTTHTVSAAATGSQTCDITVAAATATGTGVVVIDVASSAMASQHVVVDIVVGDTESTLATKVAAAIDALTGISASAAAGVVTVDAGAGETVTTAAVRYGSDQYFYQRYKGCTYASFNLSVAPNTDITGSVSIVAGTPELDYLALSGATYTSAGSNPVFTAPQVLDLTVGDMGVNSHCWTSLNITLDSQNRGIPCIGTQGDREVVLGTLTAEVSGEVYFSDQTILEALLNNDTLGDGIFTFSDADGNIYRFDFYGLKPTAGELSAGGTGQDLTIPVTLQPTPVTVCDDGSNNWLSGVIFSKVDTAPTLP